MSLLLPFQKIEATGNDFIIVSETHLPEDYIRAERIRSWCKDRTGIGADGFIYFREVENGFYMRYFNRDGSVGSMCGNGLRAATLFAVHENKLPLGTPFIIRADDGAHEVQLLSNTIGKVQLHMHGDPRNIPAGELGLNSSLKVLGFLNTGVPHLVIEVKKNLNDVDVFSIGRRLRYHPRFQPEGTNVNFIQPVSDDKLRIRTYERGVERETLSCGTGITASALIWAKQWAEQPEKIEVSARGGELTITRESDKIYLTGAVRKVFSGKILVGIDKNISDL